MTRRSLSRVLGFKGLTREQLEAEARIARNALALEEEKLGTLERQYREAEAELEGTQGRGCMTVHEMAIFTTYLQHLSRQVRQQTEAVAVCAAHVQSREQALLEAFKEEKLVEKLHDRVADAEARSAERAEQKEADYAYLARRERK